MRQNNAALLSLFLMLTPAVYAAPKDRQPDKAAMELLVRDYILQHPDVLVESLSLLQARQQETQAQLKRQAVAARRTELVEAGAPAAGDPNGITVVEFFDYHCGYCKKSETTVAQLLAENPHVRVVYKEFPILGPESLLASKAALAAKKQGAYLKMREALISSAEPMTLDNIARVGATLGLNAEQLKADMESPEVQTEIQNIAILGAALNIKATPSFVIGNEVIPGAPTLDNLKILIAKEQPSARSK